VSIIPLPPRSLDSGSSGRESRRVLCVALLGTSPSSEDEVRSSPCPVRPGELGDLPIRGLAGTPGSWVFVWKCLTRRHPGKKEAAASRRIRGILRQERSQRQGSAGSGPASVIPLSRRDSCKVVRQAILTLQASRIQIQIQIHKTLSRDQSNGEAGPDPGFPAVAGWTIRRRGSKERVCASLLLFCLFVLSRGLHRKAVGARLPQAEGLVKAPAQTPHLGESHATRHISTC
jgi:hypothetical protein